MSGVKTFQNLFPNLAVIRGKETFNNYSLILSENEDLIEIGLQNLQVIERGSVRIEKNIKLCYANTINWKVITVQEDRIDDYIYVSEINLIK